MNGTPNQLINESSPYLKQHAFNPVQWHGWNKETLEKAVSENKLIIISIGYSTCHWCHVMEKDSFENDEVAALMNEHFISIKVDREERPDIDSVYMQAVQLMTGKGGWPLNCIALPDGKPLYGGTFFPQKQWVNVLKQVSDLWKYEPNRCRQYADELIAGLHKTELLSQPMKEMNPKQVISAMVESLKKSFDKTHGGFSRVPKFPMPGNLQFLMRYAFQTGKSEVLNHVVFTLDKMAAGGIYDHLGGGFARYSTDAEWKVPHFEKMLYDNAQLISLYAAAYSYTKKESFKTVVEETIQFITRELMSPDFGFYSALDADTDGEEGKFYVWKQEEIESLLGKDAPVFCKVYQVNEKGLWENGNYVLLKNVNMKVLAEEYKLSEAGLESKIREWKDTLYLHRKKRTNPGLDNKFILGWNALMLIACCDAYRYLGNAKYLELALKNFDFIRKHLVDSHERLLHSTHPDEISGAIKRKSLFAFADDYAALGLACVHLFSITADERMLMYAVELCNQADRLFTDPDTGLLFYTSVDSERLIIRRAETEDNVIPSANSMFAHLLFQLGRLTGNSEWEERAFLMCRHVEPYMTAYPSAFSNWGMLLMNKSFLFFELAIAGKEARENLQKVISIYQPDVLLCASEKESEVSVFRNRFMRNETRFYLCMENTCMQPVKTWEEISAQLKSARRTS